MVRKEKMVPIADSRRKSNAIERNVWKDASHGGDRSGVPSSRPKYCQRYELLEAKLRESGFDLRCRHK